MNAPSQDAELIALLDNAVLDWDGTQEVNGAEPVRIPNCGQLRAIRSRLEALSKENERLKAWLNEALEGWEDGANYKGDYLKDKHGDAEDIARIRAALEQTDANESGSPSREVYGSD